MTICSKVVFWVAAVPSLICLCCISSPKSNVSVSESQHNAVDVQAADSLSHLFDSLPGHLRMDLDSWTDYYQSRDSAFSFSRFNISRNGKANFLAVGTFDPNETDERMLALNPDKTFGITYEGYFIDLTEIPEDEIGFDDSHNINLYDFDDHRIYRLHFKGISESTDEVIWLDNERVVLLGAANTGLDEWIPYVQVTNIKDSVSRTYSYSNSIKGVSPFDFLIKRLRLKQNGRPPQ